MDLMRLLLAYMTATLMMGVQNTTPPTVTPVPTPDPVATTAAIVETVAETPSPEPTVSVTPIPVPTISPNPAYHNLTVKDKGDDVRRLQERLIELGYLPEGSADGAYGGQTRTAVRRFQYYNGLQVDGVAGKTTQTNLFENPDAAPYPGPGGQNASPTVTPVVLATPTATTAEEAKKPAETDAKPAEITETDKETAKPAEAKDETAKPAENAEGMPAEEAAAEPAEKPAAEPAEEATAEPAEESTAEPTEEAAAEPAEESTAEPTEEATAEPTEEATAEPAEEATAEPTEEPTAEPAATPTPAPKPVDQSVYTEIAGWIVLNDSGAPMEWIALEDGVSVSRMPRMQRREEDGVFRISLSDVANCMEDWILTEDGGTIVLEAEGYTLGLVDEDTGAAATVDSREVMMLPQDFDFESEAHYIDVNFLTHAMQGGWTWDEDEQTLMLHIPGKHSGASD